MLRVAILLLSAISTYGCANDTTKPNKPDQIMGPPPVEAIQACVYQEEGSVCQTIGPRGESVQGQCRTTPHPMINILPVCRTDQIDRNVK